ncbi:MAG: hypothetical protein JWR13_1199, partial [Mycobacterium sp.]|nr:hypothetical protein [Mycobacterium sp.]
FVHHMNMVSASETVGRRRYFFRASRDKERALRRVYGRKQIRAIRQSQPVRLPFEVRDRSVRVD